MGAPACGGLWGSPEIGFPRLSFSGGDLAGGGGVTYVNNPQNSWVLSTRQAPLFLLPHPPPPLPPPAPPPHPPPPTVHCPIWSAFDCGLIRETCRRCQMGRSGLGEGTSLSSSPADGGETGSAHSGDLNKEPWAAGGGFILSSVAAAVYITNHETGVAQQWRCKRINIFKNFAY